MHVTTLAQAFFIASDAIGECCLTSGRWRWRWRWRWHVLTLDGLDALNARHHGKYNPRFHALHYALIVATRLRSPWSYSLVQVEI